MIIPGRPQNGYSDYENLFHLLSLELDNAISILKINLSNIITKHDADKLKQATLEKDYDKKVTEIAEEYIKKGEESEIAYSIAQGEAQSTFGSDISFLWYDDEFDIDFIKKHSIDGQVKATFILMYSSIEYSLIKLCKLLKDRVSTKLDLNDLSVGKGYIDSCFLYFDKVIEVSYDIRGYDKFKQFQQIRNTIIHNNSSTSGKDITSFLNPYKSSITIEDDRFLFKNGDFVKTFLRIVNNLLISLKLSIEKKFNFECLLYRLKHEVGYSKIETEDETIEIIDNKLIYKAKISNAKNPSFGNLSISMESSKDSTNELITEIKPDFMTAEEINKYYQNSKSTSREYLKEYRKLIKAKNIHYVMKYY